MNRHAAMTVLVMMGFSAASSVSAETGPLDVEFAENGAIAESLTGAAGDAAVGAQQYSDRTLGNCAACHVNADQPDVPFQGNIGPALDGAATRWSEAQLRGIVSDAKHTFPGSMMPSFYKVTGFIRPGIEFTSKPADEPLPPIMNAEQIENMVAYLLTLK